MKVLVIGKGGREHTIVWKISQSPLVEKIYCAPGNAGIAELAECVPIQPDDLNGLADFAKEKGIDLTVVGPEDPLAKGIVDIFELKGLWVFGPSKKAAQIEGSKVFAKELMKKYRIPSADFTVFDDPIKAMVYVNRLDECVVKADGLAAGKGVIICGNKREAAAAIKRIMIEKRFGDAGNRVVVEELLKGEEASIIAFVDGSTVRLMPSSQDHKRAFDNDKGPNTGGMGAYSPAPVITKKLERKILKEIMQPTIDALRKEGAPFKGVLYAGLMIEKGKPRVLEFNARFGDPENQVIMPRLKSDLVPIMQACIDGKLAREKIAWSRKACTCVVIASGGYPGKYEKGKAISGLEKAAKLKDTIVFHAGTKIEGKKIVTDGGRVLGVTALGEDIRESIKNTYKAVRKIHFVKMHYRTDIGKRALKRPKKK